MAYDVYIHAVAYKQQRMSSIISDLFYGSKQNILDNYLVNRHEDHQQSSHRKQQTLLQPSFIEFIIKLSFLPPTTTVLKVDIEMGERRDEGLLEIRPGIKSPVAALILHDIQKAQLNRHTSAKITVSEGKYSKVFGFVPIETIKEVAGSFSNEKTIVVQLKGKSSFPLTSLQCTIRTEFPNNNILNSEVMRSMEKDHESYIRSRHHISNQSSHNRSNNERLRNKKTVKSRPLSNNVSAVSVQRQSPNIFIDNERMVSNDKHSHAAVTQYVKQIKSIKVVFSKIELSESLKAPNDQISLRVGELEYKLDELIEVNGITRQGVTIDVAVSGKIIGSIHLSPLLLTLTKISGELPIHSALQQCLGTIMVQSPNIHDSPHPESQLYKPAPKQTQPNSEDTLNEILLLSIDKILLVRSSRAPKPYQNQMDHFDFSKMETNRVEVLVRVNGLTHRFSEVVLHYNIEREGLQVVELRRKDSFSLRYFEQAENELRIEVEVFSAYRLIAYGKASLGPSNHFVHKFMTADSECPALHCGIYLKAVRLQARPEYFQEHKVGTIFNVLEDLLSNKIILKEVGDVQIKRIMNFHEEATYVELKKLSILLKKDIYELIRFQKSYLYSVYLSQKLQANSMMVKLSQKLLEQFLYVGSSEGIVSREQFTKIIQFYRDDLKVSLEEKYEQFISNPIGGRDGILYLFFISGFYFVGSREQAIEEKEEKEDRPSDKTIIPSTVQAKKQQNNAKREEIPQNQRETAVVKAQPSYYISKISISNAHLLNQGRAPNICLSIGKKVNYSNSNPEFNLQQEVSLLDSIKVYHKSIAEERLVQLAEFHPLRRQTYYELEPTGKCLAKVTWGLG